MATDHPLAAAAGMHVLREGGSAADAAVAAAAVMVVVQPQYSHLGGDVFAMVFSGGTVEALNSSGPAPQGLDVEHYRALGMVPDSGPLSVTVPGCVGGWGELHAKYGRLPWGRLFEDAIAHAEDGFGASRGLARAVARGRSRVYPGDYFKQLFGRVEADGGQAVIQPDLARTLRSVAAGAADAFYTGEVAKACLAALGGRGAVFELEEWRSPSRWLDGLSIPFGGYRVHTQPPPSQGFVLLLALGLYENLTMGTPVREDLVGQREALRVAFGERNRLAGDPDFCGFEAKELLRPDYIQGLAQRASAPSPGGADGDTTYILAIDGEGNAVSLIQSVFAQWGSGVMVPGTGILLNNRLMGFTLRPGHPNELAPGKRPVHTLHSYLVTVDPPGPLPLATKIGGARGPAELRMVGGTPGAARQPQTNLQVLDAVLQRRADPQDALDAPRWSIGPAGGADVEVETREPDLLGNAFRAGGLSVSPFPPWDGRMGRSYIALVEQSGIAAAGDLRGEGQALVY